jgi:CDP-glycerol glycerophosphotransferase
MTGRGQALARFGSAVRGLGRDTAGSIPRTTVASGLGRHLVIAQTGSELFLDMTFRADLTAHAVWGRLIAGTEWTKLADCRPEDAAGRFTATCDLRLLLPDTPAADTVLLYVDVDLPLDDARALEAETQLALQSVPGARTGKGRGRYRLQLGDFLDTESAPVQQADLDGRLLTAHPTRSGHIAVAIDRHLPSLGEVYVTRLSAADGRLRLAGRIETMYGDLESAALILKGRSTGVRVSHSILVTRDNALVRRSFGLRCYPFDVSVDWAAALLGGPTVEDDILDAFMQLDTRQSAEPFEVRVGKTKFWARLRTQAGQGEHSGRAALLTPYYTFKAKRTSFHLNVFAPETMDYLRRSVRRRHLMRWAHRGKPIWLVGEMPYKAQDTGLAFFRYLRKNHPEIDAYYVMDPDSPEMRNVAPLGHVLKYRSKEHIRATLLADRVFSSHHPDHLYPVRTKGFRRSVRATKIFLQHGVMGTKWMVPNYGKSVEAFETDLFIVSSEREKEYIVGDFGYEARDVAVTGLSRFDTLFNPDTPVKRQLLILPTWREWIVDADIYLDSEYHQRWNELLHDDRLQALATKHDLEIVFCLHPNMQRFIAEFADAPVRVISQGEVDVQHLMKESAALLTDYSSVGFDFSFLHRPVVYYQFDQSRFLGPTGSHLDLDSELPGPIMFTAEEVLSALESLADNGFEMSGTYQRRADRFVAHRDRHSSERIFAAGSKARSRNTWLRRLASGEVATAGLRFFQRSEYYYPAMRLLLKGLRRLPADENLVVFESGVGRQYADSPRYVHEELVRRESPLKKVWAYSGKIHHRDDLTKVVPRLSPAYFWYLGRARYWVNNQNFPHYVHRRPDGIYLQTWHGTPLKRMLHDLDTIVGRDEGYIHRVTTAAQQWSLLASPSPWTTDRMRSAFHYDGPVVEVGYPRNDIFFRDNRDEVAAMVRRRLGIPQDKTVVLYAPTFRDDQASQSSRFDFRLPLDLDALHASLGDDVVFLIRQHGLVRSRVDIPEELTASVKDVSSYPEIQELFLASDALVTDYSSVFFDFACLRRPIVFYAFDLESYRDELRGFYLDYETELPGPIVTTEKELYAALQSLPAVTAEYGDRYSEFIERFSPRDDGHAARRLVDEMLARGPKPHLGTVRRLGRAGRRIQRKLRG